MVDARVLQVLVPIGVAVVALSYLARRVRVPAPLVLLVGGAGLAFLPWVADVALPPEVVLLVFLPALLYWESLTTSLREIRANLRVVLLQAIALVIVTAGAVAVVGHQVGLSWPVAWVLGAVLAPTDATAVAAVARGMPRRSLTILRAESLINDGTALVLFAIAVEVATGERAFSWGSTAGSLALSYAGGVAAGLLVAWLAVSVRRIVHDPLLENGISVVTPFAAFLVAEQVHASGVLAVVVCGLTLSQLGPRTVPARTRVQAVAFWQLTAFLLNGTLFVLVGLQLRGAVADLSSYSLGQAALIALLVAVTVIGTRLIWSNTVVYVIRALDRRPQQRLRRVGARQRLPIAWAGFRGGVSLAAALAVPVTLEDGSPFPGRDLIVLVTFGVILVTLLAQGLTLPAVLRWARLPEDRGVADEERLAQRVATEAGLAALPAVAAELAVPPAAADRVRTDYLDHLDALVGSDSEASAANGEHRAEQEAYERLRGALLAHKRTAVVQLRDTGRIDDIVLRRVQARLDREEVRLTATADDD